MNFNSKNASRGDMDAYRNPTSSIHQQYQERKFSNK